MDIYSQYKIPPNLQRHQCEVAAVGQYLARHWVGRRIEEEKIILALLVHDMGNIIKFKRPFLGELESQAAYWESVQGEFRRLYGDNAHDATIRIVSELGLPEIVTLLQSMRHVWEDPESHSSLEAQICEYADCCVTPEGIVGFEVRIKDLQSRYHLSEKSQAIGLMRENAKRIEMHVNVSLKDMTHRDFSKEVELLRRWPVL